jgi:hypothetical protein
LLVSVLKLSHHPSRHSTICTILVIDSLLIAVRAPFQALLPHLYGVGGSHNLLVRW